MTFRQFIGSFPWPTFLRFKRRLRFVFNVKTVSGSIVGNIVIEGHDEAEARTKLQQRYPGCQVLDVEMR